MSFFIVSKRGTEYSLGSRKVVEEPGHSYFLGEAWGGSWAHSVSTGPDEEYRLLVRYSGRYGSLASSAGPLYLYRPSRTIKLLGRRALQAVRRM